MIPAAELRARVVVMGVPKGNRELMKFDGTLKQVASSDATASLKADVDQSGFNDFAAHMVDAKNSEATAALKANVDGAGFTEFKVAMTDAKLRAAKPIVAEAKLKYEKGTFSELRRELFLTQKAMGGFGGSGGGLGSALSGALMPFGKIGTAAVAASGPVLSLAGGLTSVAGSAVGAAEGLGAVGLAAGGVAAVGIGGIVGVAIPAVMSLKALTEAQKSYVAAVETYGVQSTQAETAAKKLKAAERSSGKEAVTLVGTLDSVKERWQSLTKPGREAFLGGLSDALDRVDKKLPLLANSANRSAQVGRKGFDSFLNQVTGPDFERFIKTMTRTEEDVLPQLSHATGDWGRILERIATDAAPSLERVVGIFGHWSNEVLGSTNNSHKLQGEISHLTTDFMDWVHLLTASGSLLHDIFDAGEGSGNELVVDTTKQFEEWGAWINSHGPQVEGFFEQTKDGVKALASILSHAGKDWFVMSQAMEPIELLLLKILDSFSKVKIFGQSMLTYLLGGFALLKAAIAAVKIKDLVEGFQALRALTAATTAETDLQATALTAQADAAGVAAAANVDLASSQKLLIANSSGAVVGTYEGGAMAPVAAAAGGGMLEKLGKAAGFAGAGFLGGQVVGQMVGGKAGGVLSAAGSGAGLGAAAGTFFPEFGGPVTGAAIGAGVGAAVQGIQDLLGHEKQLAPVQQRLAAESKHTADALRNQRDAAQGLARAHGNLQIAEEHQKSASTAVHRAEQQLSVDRKRYGADTNRVRGDELLLARAKQRDAQATKEVGQAHQLSGASLKLYNHLTVVAAASTKTHIADLKQEFQAQFQKFKQEESNTAVAKKAQQTLSELNGEQRKLSSLYNEAGSKSGPKLQHTIENLSAAQSQWGKSFKGMLALLPELPIHVQTSTQKLEHTFGHFTDVFKTGTSAPFQHDVGSMNTASSTAMLGISATAFKTLKGLGVGKADFTTHPQKKQTGGFIVPGTGSGDSFQTSLPPGSFVMNREATAALPFQAGGGVPVALEPKERVFMPHEVQKIGAGNLHSWNQRVQRFQKGGSLGPEPMLGGPFGMLRSIGQSAISEVYKGAESFIAKHKPKGGEAGYMSGGGGPVIAQIGRILRASGLNKIGAAGIIGNAKQESGWNPSSVGSGGGGLWGFTSGEISLSALQDFAKQSGKAWTDVGLQTQFLLNHVPSSVISGLNASKNASAAAAYFMNEWERPAAATENQANREAGARQAFAMGYQHGGSVRSHHRHHGSPPVGSPSWIETLHSASPKWAGWTPDGRYDPAAVQHLITGGKALAVPTHIKPTPSSAETAASKATPTKAVQWEMSHLGDSDQWGYPGEWCGAFQAAGMEAIGLTPPSGFPSAASWAGYGTNLGKGHIQAGAILDYGGAHVAMAISSSEQIQGNDIHESVGTSGIGGIIGGSPLTAVRWPPYGSGPGAGSTPKETVPKVFKGARTDKLSIGSSTPKTIHGIQREVARREKELDIYRHAAAEAKGRPELQRKIQANVTVLETRLSQLRKAASQLRRKIAETKFGKHLGRSLGHVTGFEKLIESAQREYQERSEFAEHTVDLEPTEPILASNATEAQRAAAEKTYVGELSGYISGKEGPAYAEVLGSEADWRKTILGGEHAATSFGGLQESRIRVLEGQIEGINALTASTASKAAKWRKNNPGKPLPATLQGELGTSADQRATLPVLRFQEAERRKVLGEARTEFYGGRKSPVQPPTAPLAGTGSFEQALIEVQGVHWPGLHSPSTPLPATRSASGFGGAIWETQEAIEGLGLRIKQAQAGIAGSSGGEEGAGKTQREELLEGLLREKNQRTLISNALEPTLSAYEATYPVMGAFAKGGVALVGERGPELAHMPSGTRIHSATDTERLMGGGDVHVNINGRIVQEPGDSRDAIEVWMRNPRNQKLVRQVINTTPKGATTSGAGRAFRP